MKKYLVALDQGTTSSRAIVFDRSQQIVASAQKEFPQLYPQAGWVCLLYTSPSPRDRQKSSMPSSA